MATEIKTWQIINNELIPVEAGLTENNRYERDHLEKWIKTNPKILGDNILLIGEQVYTKSGPLDYLAIDSSGNTIIIELKRENLPREVLAQAIDYASDVAKFEIDRIAEICLRFTGQNLEDLMVETFDNVELEDITINQNQRILLVGFGIEEALGRMIEWMSSKYDVSINAAILQYIKTSSGDELISRTVIISEEVAEEKSNKRKFKIAMSDEPGKYEIEKLKELLTTYLKDKTRLSAQRIKTIMLPALLKKDLLSREELLKIFVKLGESESESKAGYSMALISSQLGHEWNDFLRQVINYSYPNNSWTKDNFNIRPEYKILVKELLKELKQEDVKHNQIKP